MQLTRLHQVGANFDDINETRDFYTNILGARFIAEYDPPGLLFFEFSGVRVLFEKGNDKGTLYFWVDDIEASHTELREKGVKFDTEPHMIFPDAEGTFGTAGEEEWMAFFKAPGGNTIALATRR